MNRDEKSKISKDKIIKAAFSLFSTKGYDATSTQDIIDLTGLSRGAMYHHFKNKEEVLKCITQDFQEQMNNFLKDLVMDDKLGTKEKISKLIEFSSGSYTHKQLIQCCWVEKVPFALLEEIRNLNKVATLYISKILKQGIEKGEFVCDYPQELAELLVLSIDVWLNPVLFRRSYDEVCRRLDFLMILLEKMQIPIIDLEVMQKIKNLFKQG